MSEASNEPKRARAVLSNEDFKLIQEAIRFYIQTNPDAPDSVKYVNLHHRLGSAGRR